MRALMFAHHFSPELSRREVMGLAEDLLCQCDPARVLGTYDETFFRLVHELEQAHRAASRSNAPVWVFENCRPRADWDEAAHLREGFGWSESRGARRMRCAMSALRGRVGVCA